MRKLFVPIVNVIPDLNFWILHQRNHLVNHVSRPETRRGQNRTTLSSLYNQHSVVQRSREPATVAMNTWSHRPVHGNAFAEREYRDSLSPTIEYHEFLKTPEQGKAQRK